MRKILLVAQRDFTATVSSKGFLLGLFVMPVMILLVMMLIPRIMSSTGPRVRGEIAVIDPTGSALPELRAALSPGTLAAIAAQSERRDAPRGAPISDLPVGSPGMNPPFRPGHAPPLLTIIERPKPADVQQEKSWLIQPPRAEPRHLALIVIAPDALARAPGKTEYASYDLYAAHDLDESTETTIFEGLRRALVASRLKAMGLDQDAVQAAMRVTRPSAVIVAPAGERVAQRGLRRALPFICGILLFIGVITGGQLLMTSTVEEKSSRVVEVLLAAVSPLELMAGKLLAQLGVGLLIVGMYVGIGILALGQFAQPGVLNPMLVVYLLVFYAVAYLVFCSLMLAIVAAVNQIADAQSLMGPVMLLLVIPYVMTQFIGMAPNAPWSVALSFIPPANTFAMLARLASDAPPPLWQVCVTLAIGLATAAAAVWFAAKIFKIGLLMHGKPPNFATLVRWARMA